MRPVFYIIFAWLSVHSSWATRADLDDCDQLRSVTPPSIQATLTTPTTPATQKKRISLDDSRSEISEPMNHKPPKGKALPKRRASVLTDEVLSCHNRLLELSESEKGQGALDSFDIILCGTESSAVARQSLIQARRKRMQNRWAALSINRANQP